MRSTRREFLLGTAVAAGSLAGCLGTSDPGGTPGDDRATAVTSFFVLYDFASNVAGGESVRNLVPFGQHGHGWEPGPDIQRSVLDADAFVYVGEGFQPWADKVVRNVREDAPDVQVIDAWHDVDLLDASDDHADHDAGEGDHESHDESSDGEHEGSSDEDHGHAAKDPHFWLDPERATQSVETITDGLAAVAPDRESVFRENADAFVDRLAALDETYVERLADRTRDTVLVAGHNSFRYLGRHYDIRVEALTGLAPDAQPSPRDVARAQAVIEEHDVEYVLAPVFESDRAARQLVDETDATGVLPLTPVPSITEEWQEQGWGFIEILEQVNLPSLERALGADSS